jgi:hypothetical protein
MTRYGTFLTILERFKNHIFYERNRMKKLALFLTEIYVFVSIITHTYDQAGRSNNFFLVSCMSLT